MGHAGDWLGGALFGLAISIAGAAIVVLAIAYDAPERALVIGGTFLVAGVLVTRGARVAMGNGRLDERCTYCTNLIALAQQAAHCRDCRAALHSGCADGHATTYHAPEPSGLPYR